MPRCEAMRRLREGVGDKELYDTVLLATGSKAAASEAIAVRLKARLAAGEKPGFY